MEPRNNGCAQNPPIVYLGGPIRSVGFDRSSSWRAFMSAQLAIWGYTTFNPAAAFHRPDEIDREVARAMEEINRRAIDMSLIVVAVLDQGSVNLGTIRELEAGVTAGKRSMVMCDYADLTKKVSAHDLEVYGSLPDMIHAITGDNLAYIRDEWQWWQEQDIEDAKREAERSPNSSDFGITRSLGPEDLRGRDPQGSTGPAGSNAGAIDITGILTELGAIRSYRSKGSR